MQNKNIYNIIGILSSSTISKYVIITIKNIKNDINIKDDIDGIEKLSNSEKAILIISKGNDKRKDLVDLTKCIKMLNVNYGGYLM